MTDQTKPQSPDRITFSLKSLVPAIAAFCFLILIPTAALGVPLPADEYMRAMLQSLRTTSLDTLMVGLTLLGNTAILLSVSLITAVALIYQRSWRLLCWFVATAVISPLTVSGLKLLIGRARPIADLYEGMGAFSFPSGHTTNSAVIYGMLALLILHGPVNKRRALLGVMSICIIALVGLSRLYLQAHWLTDIAAGYALATCIIWPFYKFGHPTVHSDVVLERRVIVLALLAMTMVVSIHWNLSSEAALKKYFQRSQVVTIS